MAPANLSSYDGLFFPELHGKLTYDPSNGNLAILASARLPSFYPFGADAIYLSNLTGSLHSSFNTGLVFNDPEFDLRPAITLDVIGNAQVGGTNGFHASCWGVVDLHLNDVVDPEERNALNDLQLHILVEEQDGSGFDWLPSPYSAYFRVPRIEGNLVVGPGLAIAMDLTGSYSGPFELTPGESCDASRPIPCA